jgi:hypothetical protein
LQALMPSVRHLGEAAGMLRPADLGDENCEEHPEQGGQQTDDGEPAR